MKVYLVGGAVRDLVLGRVSKDHDYVVTGVTYDDMVKMGFKPIEAQSFPVFHHPITGDEWALARKERKTGPGYHGFETVCDPTITIEDDLYRRDLTINSMAYEIPVHEDLNRITGLFPYFSEELIIDPYNGSQDLKAGIIRHTSKAFSEDPVRVLRVARFAARYGFNIHNDTMNLMHQMVADGELEYLTVERVWLEIAKVMSELYPSKFFQTLYDLNLNHVVNHIFKDKSELINIGPNLTLIQRCMLFAVLPECNLTELVLAFYKLKAPSNIVIGIDRFGQILNELRQKFKSPEQIYKIIELYDGFKHPDNVKDILAVIDAMIEYYKLQCDHPQVIEVVSDWKWYLIVIVDICREIRGIGFNDLPLDQQNTLKGSEIGEAIKQYRLDIINRIINLYKY